MTEIQTSAVKSILVHPPTTAMKGHRSMNKSSISFGSPVKPTGSYLKSMLESKYITESIEPFGGTEVKKKKPATGEWRLVHGTGGSMGNKVASHRRYNSNPIQLYEVKQFVTETKAKPELAHALSNKTERVLNRLLEKKPQSVLQAPAFLQDLNLTQNHSKYLPLQHPRTNGSILHSVEKHHTREEETNSHPSHRSHSEAEHVEVKKKVEIPKRVPDYFTLHGVTGYFLFEKFPIIQFDASLFQSKFCSSNHIRRDKQRDDNQRAVREVTSGDVQDVSEHDCHERFEPSSDE